MTSAVSQSTLLTQGPGPSLASAALWQLGKFNGRPALRLGKRWLALDEVYSYGVEKVSERDNEGLIFNFALFGLLACAFVIPVLHEMMEPKFLIAAGLLGAIALMSLSEVIFAKKIEYFQLDFTMRNGEAISFTSSNAYDVAAILKTMQRLDRG